MSNYQRPSSEKQGFDGVRSLSAGTIGAAPFTERLEPSRSKTGPERALRPDGRQRGRHGGVRGPSEAEQKLPLSAGSTLEVGEALQEEGKARRRCVFESCESVFVCVGLEKRAGAGVCVCMGEKTTGQGLLWKKIPQRVLCSWSNTQVYYT